MQRELRIELGRAWLAAEEAAGLDVGSRIVLDSPPDRPWQVYVDGRRIAAGPATVMDGTFHIRVQDMTEGLLRPGGPAGPAAPGQA